MEEIGDRIKALRKKAGMSLKELAEKTETTSSFLSQVENNLTALSISTLNKVSKVLNVKMSYLLGEVVEEANSLDYLVLKPNERKTLKSFGKGLKLQFLSTLDNKHILEPTIHILDPKRVSGIPPYQHEGQEIIYILKGKIMLHLANQNIVLEKDDSCYFDSNLGHSFESLLNEGEGECHVLCISSQAFFS